jgi:SET and MYND domain-containing protein
LQLLPVGLLFLLDRHSRSLGKPPGITRPHASPPQVPGAGRGLFAAEDIAQGTVVIEEAPMLCAPSPHVLHSTCHHCLRPLSASHSPTSGGAIPLCSSACEAAAQAEWAEAAARCDFRPLQRACQEAGEKFPLMLARLACLEIQRLQQQRQLQQPHNAQLEQQQRQPTTVSEVSRSTPRPGAVSAVAGGEAARGDPATQLRHLCYAKLAEVPPPWAQMHGLLLRGLQPLAAGAGGGLSSQQLQHRFSLDWFAGALARLHLNAFRVDTVPPLDAAGDPAALLRAAAASLAGAASSAHAAGSAVYLLASMLNHSCQPSLDVAFPRNNASLALVAARDVAAGEQLTISYVDAGQGVAARRAALQWGYGFACACPRCVEEGREGGEAAPLAGADAARS